MYLSALTLKGFKSFASATTLRFERGITCVVGPNGSGKSNVVDAISWVLGEQGARTLRGGSMADVIFAGTAARSPLGRAEVSLTFDNSDGSIPEGAAEVTVTRTMFRSGGSDYSINGRSCRLLDIQDMLGDAGIGRELHVLVGQGRVDAVLTATPQERRLFLEEAAGVIKHRRRKEKALRKLAAMDGNLVRLADLTSEVARQLKPLGRQARTARRARRFAADARDARLRLLADDLAAATAALTGLDPADGVTTTARLADVERELATAEESRLRAGAAVGQAAPGVAGWREAATRGTAVHERLRAIVRLSEDRLRLLRSRSGGLDGLDPDAAARVAADDAAAAAEAVAELERVVGAAQEDVRTLVQARVAAEEAHAAGEREATRRSRIRAKARDDVLRAQAERASAQAKVDAVEAEAERARSAREQAQARHDELLREVEAESVAPPAGEVTDSGDAVADQAADADAAAVDVATTELAAAEARLRGRRDAHENAVASLKEADGAERSADRHRASARAMVEALTALSTPADASAFVTRRHPAAEAVSQGLGVVAGHEVAIAAALGATADAVTLTDLHEAAAATSAVASAGAGRVSIVIPGGAGASPVGVHAGADLPVTDPSLAAVAAAVLLTGDGAIAHWARRRLAATVVTEDLATAVAVVKAAPGLTAVTGSGDVVTVDTIEGGSPPAATSLQRVADLASARSALADAEAVWSPVHAAAEAARQQVAVTEHDLEQARTVRSDAAAAVAAAERRRAAAVAEAERRQAAAAAEVRRRHAAAEARVQAAVADLRRAVAAHEQVVRRRLECLADVERASGRLEQLLGAAAQTPVERTAGNAAGADPEAGDGIEVDVTSLAVAARAAREDETTARLSLRTIEERLASAHRQAQAAGAAAAAAALAARAAEEESRRTRQALTVAGEVHAEAGAAAATAARVRTVAVESRGAQQAAHDAAAAAYSAAGAAVQSLTAERVRLSERVHAEELARTEHRLRREAVVETAAADFGYAPEDLVEQFGPHMPVPVLPDVDPATDDPDADARAADDPEADAQVVEAEPEAARPTRPYDRDEQTRRLRAAEKALATLGSINPLAMEEYAALEERHRFLLQQQQDLTDSKRDLMAIIRDVDERVEQVVAEAFVDTAAHFAEVVGRLFPGGAGRLVLTDPDDLLNAGIEVEARPAGKTVKRLSLLSGGERTLVALAFLVALFKARPSPFYVLDEIEAALDDTNLGRLLGILTDLRETSQLIVVTHQRRTMESADALYGVTMRGDGVSTVISQRLRDSVTSQ